MKHVKILDTTLRDGGRVINCAYSDAQIQGIINGLVDANIDIIEMGFLRSQTVYAGNSTFFTEMEQFEQFIPQDKKNSEFVVFCDYGKEFKMWDFSKIKPSSETRIDGFRVGYRKKDLMAAVDTFKTVMANGYKLYIQGVESLSYSEEEMLAAIKVINEIHPHCFGIVDTYGAMYKDDVLRLFNLVNDYLDEGIAIDFHTHNNMQMSFAFAQEIIEASQGKRNVVIDGTLEGVGKGAANLNTELIVDYLCRKKNYDYKMDSLLDTIDDYVEWIKTKESWGYSIPNFMAGIYSSHANNIIYLTEKHRMRTKDIKHLISMIEPSVRKRYDYDNIERLYIEYNSSNVDDSVAITELKSRIAGREVVVCVPGSSVEQYRKQIDLYIAERNAVAISVNFLFDERHLAFYGNERRYPQNNGRTNLVTSNVKNVQDQDLVFNYNKYIDRTNKYFDNSTIVLLNILAECGVERITFAGFDGFDTGKRNYYSSDYIDHKTDEERMEANLSIEVLLKNYNARVSERIDATFLTPSRFAHIFDSKDEYVE